MKRSMVMLTAVPVVSLLAGCSASTTTTPTPTTAATATATATATIPPTTAPTPTAAPAVDLSGSWSGQYSGTFSGTFTLQWTQSSATLSGDIAVSTSPNPLHVSGQVAGTAITFGAVDGVTYSGSVSGNSMSGSYQVPGGGGGTWSATKS